MIVQALNKKTHERAWFEISNNPVSICRMNKEGEPLGDEFYLVDEQVFKALGIPAEIISALKELGKIEYLLDEGKVAMGEGVSLSSRVKHLLGTLENK